MGRHLALIAALLAGGALAVGAASAHRLPKAPKCPILPSSNHFDKRVDKLPVASNSDTIGLRGRRRLQAAQARLIER
jgi:hypothetical protein